MVRRISVSELEIVMDIWLKANLSAHSFIEADYWEHKYGVVKNAIQNAEVYAYDENGTIKGFIGMIDNYIAGLFVAPGFQHAGTGSALLSYAVLTLHVYAENRKAVRFYQKHGFKICAEQTDENTKHIEYEMKWAQ